MRHETVEVDRIRGERDACGLRAAEVDGVRDEKA